MKSMHKLTKLSLSFLMIVMMISSLTLLSSAASDKFYPIIEDKHDELDYSESFSHSFTLNYNSQVRIFFQGYNYSHKTYGKYAVEIKNSSNEIVYSVSDQSSYANKEHLTDELSRGDYTLNIRCNSTSTYDDFEFCLNLSYKIIEDVLVESITLDKSTLQLCNDDTASLAVKFTPIESSSEITWSSSDTKVATVSSSGEVKGVAAGTATITATAGDKSATCQVTVFSAEGGVHKTLISTKKGTVYEGKIKTNEFTLLARSHIKINFTGRRTYSEYTYGKYEINIKDSNGQVVYSASGESNYEDKSLTFVLPKGTYTFSLTSGDKSSSTDHFDYIYQIYYMLLEDIQVESITLNKSTLHLCQNDKATLKATVEPTEIEDKVIWKSSNTKVATVSSSGEVKCVAAGTATITATAGDKKVTCKVTVFSTEGKTYKTLIPTQIGIVEEGQSKQSKFTLNAYSRIKISFTGFDSKLYEGTYGRYAIQIKNSKGDVVYSVKHEDEVTYDDVSHTVKVLPKGTYTFILTPIVREYNYGDWDDDFNYIYKISYMTVADVKLNKVKMSATSTSLAKGKSITITATPNPSYVTIKPQWSSSNTKVATVNSSGKITAKALGNATITAKIGAKKGTCKVKVSSMSATVIKKKTTKLASYITNISGYKSAIWSSSNTSIATVDKTGKVTGKSYGYCQIYCTINKVKYTFNVTVKPALSVQASYVDDTDIYNEAGFKFTNNTGLDITYVTVTIAQYDNRGYKLKGPYTSYNINDTIWADHSRTFEFWVNDSTKKAVCTITKVWFSDGTTWTP